MATLFSRIIDGTLPGAFVFSEARWVAFLDIKPSAYGHVLLVPRHAGQFIADLPDETLAELGSYLRRLTRVVKSACAAPAVNVVVNDGPEAGQLIAHAHLHVIPRFADDHNAPFTAHLDYPAGELARTAERMRLAWEA